MSAHLPAAISVDVDTLASIYKGYGCRRPGGYSYTELRMGIENLSRFLESFGAKATLFMAGNDFLPASNHEIIRFMVRDGHEIANHTLSHQQDFRLLTVAQKEAEISGMEELCEQVTGYRPVGFRAPGWNVNDDVLPILLRRGYRYDSSLFPTSLMPILKFLHLRSMSGREGRDRTTMGRWRYIAAPTTPYRTSLRCLAERGLEGLVEIPVTVTPLARLPFFATFLLATGPGLFARSLGWLRSSRRPIQFQFHLSDFVDYSHPELVDQVPGRGDGVYVPQALRTPLKEKVELFHRALSMIAEDYGFATLEERAGEVT